jgi:hypothetical protein
LAADSTSWEIDALDDVLPYDFFGEWFNYREYMDQVTALLANHTRDTSVLVRLIHACIHFYAGHHHNDLERLAECVRLDPAFPYYKMRLARALLDRDQRNNAQRAGGLLEELATGTALFPEAVDELEKLTALGLYACEDLSKLQTPVSWARERSIPIHNERRLLIKHRKTRTPRWRWIAERGDNADERPPQRWESETGFMVTALVPVWGDLRKLTTLLDRLTNQTISARIEIVVAEPPEAKIPGELRTRFTNLRSVAISANCSFVSALNACIQNARGRYLTVCAATDRRRPDALEFLVCALEEEAEDARLAYADTTTFGFEDDAQHGDGILFWPEFDRRRLFRGNYVSPHALWHSDLHRRYGDFDASYGPASEYEFWLRIAPTEKFLHVDEALTWYMYPAHDAADNRNADSGPEAAQRARELHWPGAWGPLPTEQQQPTSHYFCPRILFEPSIEIELIGQCDMKTMTARQSSDILGLVALYDAAIHSNDLVSVELALRTMVTLYPTLVSARLILANLAHVLHGAAAAGEILAQAATLNPNAIAVLRAQGVNSHVRGELGAAEQFLCRALQLDPHNTTTLECLDALARQSRPTPRETVPHWFER